MSLLIAESLYVYKKTKNLHTGTRINCVHNFSHDTVAIMATEKVFSQSMYDDITRKGDKIKARQFWQSMKFSTFRCVSGLSSTFLKALERFKVCKIVLIILDFQEPCDP